MDLCDRDTSAFDIEPTDTIPHPSTSNPAWGVSPRAIGCRLGTATLCQQQQG